VHPWPWDAPRRRLAGSLAQDGRLPSLVVGHYQPLADNSGLALKAYQSPTKLALCSRIREHVK